MNHQQVRDIFNEEVKLTKELFDVCLISLGWKFDFSKTHRTIGDCHYGKKTIRYSENFITSDESSIRNTIKHEIAHALTPGHKHGRVWRQVFLKMGGSGTRCAPATGLVSAATHKYELIDTTTNKVLRKFYRKPTSSFTSAYIPGRMSETIGKLKVVKVK